MTIREPEGRPVWAEISKRNLLSNYEKLQAASPQADLLVIVKANAYGHGLQICAPLLAESGARWLGVTGAEEGLASRALCPEAEILLLSGIYRGDVDAAIEQRLTPVVWEPHHLDLLEKAAARHGLGPGMLPVHLEIDTGMSRQGVRVVSPNPSPHRSPEHDTRELAALLGRFDQRSSLRLAGVLTHFSAPEVLFSERENPQIENLSAALDFILANGHRPQWLHAGNSSTLAAGTDRQKLAAMATRSGARLMVRPGLALYGYLDHITCDGEPLTAASPLAAFEARDLQPVLAWKTRVASLRSIRRGDTAGYDNTFVASRPTRLALLPLGYADGVNRLLSNRGHVLIRGLRAPIAGRVSMDQVVVDVTGIPSISIGDEAVLIGSQGEDSITAWEIAGLTGSVPWEVLCAIGSRVPRIPVE